MSNALPFSFSVPPSKSVGNRLLVMAYLSGCDSFVQEVADGRFSNDLTQFAQALLALRSGADTLFVGESGTAMRFLLSLLAVELECDRSVLIYGAGRLHKRPVAPLQEPLALRGLSFAWSGLEEWPMRVSRYAVESTSSMPRVRVSSQVSSQFVSALMLAAPYWPKGLCIQEVDSGVSVGYICLTYHLMKQAGAHVVWHNSNLMVCPGGYNPESICMLWRSSCGDWSCAGYLYQWVALSRCTVPVQIQGIGVGSGQPDEYISRLMEPLGISTREVDGGISIVYTKSTLTCLPPLSCKDMPDLVPTWVVTLLALGIPFSLHDVAHLVYKESNRIEQLCSVAHLLGFHLEYQNGVLFSRGETKTVDRVPVVIDPAGDHRMAMSWAALPLAGYSVEIANPEVVQKSFPAFWELWKQFCANKNCNFGE